MEPIMTVREARGLLGKRARTMTDEEVENTVATLTVIAREALQQAQLRRQRKNDAMALAELTYNIYQDKRRLNRE